MNTLLVFATEMEMNKVFPNGAPKGYDCLVSGVGILATSISLSKTFQKKAYKNAIQIGIAGAYRSSRLTLERVVEVKSDCLVEFLPWEPNLFFASGTSPLNKELPLVKGTTVLHCSDNESIGNVRGQFAEIETMEGAAFFAVCKEYGVLSVQIRAVSNYAAEVVSKSEWKIDGALDNLRRLFNQAN